MSEALVCPNAGSPKRPCSTGLNVGVRGGLRVPFARCGDGVARHIDRIAQPDAGPFHCLDCDEKLSLRRIRGKRTHFAHRPDSQCTGETALHRFAKELLAQARTVTFPPLILSAGKLVELIFEGGRVALDEVRIEVNEGNFHPDTVVRVADELRAIEFKVSHAVDDEKAAKVRNRDYPMVEIDLSNLRARGVTADQLEEAILHSAYRFWVHHPDTAAGEERLADRVAQEKQKRGARLRGHIARRPRGAKVPDNWYKTTFAALEEARLDHLIGITTRFTHWFTVPAPLWQAAVLDTLVLHQCRKLSPGSGLKLRGEWPNTGRLSHTLPDWMLRTDLAAYPRKSLEEAGYPPESYGSVEHAVYNYLAEITHRAEAIYWDRDEECFRVERDLHTRIHHLERVRQMLLNICTAAGAKNPPMVVERWLERFNVDGRNPKAVIAAGSVWSEALVERVRQLELMADAHWPHVTDDLCGLPLHDMRQAKIDEIAAQEAAKQKKLDDERAGRRSSIERRARASLGIEADLWLESPHPVDAIPMFEWASQSADNLHAAEDRLFSAERDRAKHQRRDRAIADLRSTLVAAAEAAFGGTDRAHLFLHSAHNRTMREHPYDICTSKPQLKLILGLLPRRR
jgi:hypothetical protein